MGLPPLFTKLVKAAALHIERRGQDVVVVEGFPPETTEKLVESAFEATKTELTHESGRA